MTHVLKKDMDWSTPKVMILDLLGHFHTAYIKGKKITIYESMPTREKQPETDHITSYIMARLRE
jgi:hypothetical protein